MTCDIIADLILIISKEIYLKLLIILSTGEMVKCEDENWRTVDSSQLTDDNYLTVSCQL